jgi:branched-chain amino acid transport system permease protein
MLVLTTAIAGLAAGAAYALVGLSTLMTYRFVAVVNFSQTAVGAMGAFVMADLWGRGTPLLVAVVAGTAVAAALHALIGLGLVMWFSEGTVAVKTAVTIAIFAGLVAFGSRFYSTEHPREFPSPFSGGAVTIGEVTVTWLVIVSCGAALALAAGASLLLSRTRLGLRLRALSARPTTAELVGVPASRIAVIVWAGTGALTALALMLVAPQFSSDFPTLSLLITAAFAAALVGMFHSFWWTLAGGLGLGVLQGAMSSLSSVKEYRGVLPLLVILAVLLWSQRREQWETA